MDKILIYSNLKTERLSYIFRFIFEEILNLRFEICNSIELYQHSKLPKFVYSTTNIKGKHTFLQAHPILFEEKIREIPIDFFIYNKQPAFFKSSSESFFPFDLFAASFYLISRYEEYLGFNADKFGRFTASESIAFKMDFLEEPVIDNWAFLFKKVLLDLFPQLKFKERSFKYLSTIDIDNAYAHLHKGLFRTTLSLFQTAVIRKGKLLHKINVLTGRRKDPYDNYDYLNKVHQSKNIDVLYFILFSRYGKYDKNLSMSSKAFQSLIKKITKSNEIGIHPSYRSNNKFTTLEKEKKSLEQIIGQSITKSRQHFLKLMIPETYEKLIALGITSDYTMGYASNPGFRASTCTPFYFFNLKTNKSTNLKVFPFAIMDVCFKDYLKCSPANTLKKIKKIITSVKKVDGLFVSLWHNENISEKSTDKKSRRKTSKTLKKNNLTKHDKNIALAPNSHQLTWRDVYEQMLDEARSRN